MAKRLSTIGRLLYGIAIGDALGNLSKRNTHNAMKADFDLSQADFDFVWTPTTGLTLAITRAISLGYTRANVMHNFSEWWRNGQFSMTNTLQTDRFETEIQSIIDFELTRDLDSIGTTDPAADDENILIRVMPIAFYETARIGSSFINDEKSMASIHNMVSLTNNYPAAMMSAGMVSFLISQILGKESLDQALENSIAITYEYYSQRSIFQPDLINFARMNMPDMANLKADDLIHNGNAIHTLENVYWVLFSTDNLKDAIRLTVKTFSKQRQTILAFVCGVYAMIDRGNLDERMIEQIDRKPITNAILRVANRSNRFHMRT
ncbi:ADP-ribosylglycohydrolase family protein [Oenococcus kitaharae]|uniref:ADP-ribosylglycohydrolase n=1 Tax=Oenococcus kitaharae DSM 17330 TaxID=1045004 RepID=G9WJU1_9LACO|nr:ADP-ribosylglycohydrolase family protein [Oenococcus kitaharae]EHN59290.1 ADP-ribosylglycohydrolase [Oenococcus kitaharae DSM 17330]OEY82188.1 ADP-ribosylglycohydrolase [Oenococcus kitaharae]OEY82611.1 ADP-ribosylglycohydrolase [Oenococcus kitaharae]OEY84867.1 ADP-ribosylglycohydrolase [Oenococcus kitaharae]